MSQVVIIPDTEFAARAHGAVNPHLSILVEQRDEDVSTALCYVSEWQGAPVARALDAAGYILDAGRRLIGTPVGRRSDYPRLTVFQAKDEPAEASSVSWERQTRWNSVRLVPDLYYYVEKGYEGFLPDVPVWNRRRPAIVWRGSSTGFPVGLGEDNLAALPRYRLCHAALGLGAAADVKLSGIVQAYDASVEQSIVARAQAEGLMGAFLPMTRMADYKLVADIDGNSNSWNFMAKLRLGACVLRVDSDWEQWFSAALVPWKHYIPVSADLSDFCDLVEWCLTHDREAEAIARQGREFALAMRFEDEMTKMARTIFDPEAIR